MQRDREGWRSVLPVTLVLLLLAFGFGSWQRSLRLRGQRTPVETGVSLLIGPPRVAMVAIGNGLGDFVAGVFHGSSLKRENALLRERLATAAMYDETTRRLEQEVDSLRRLNGMKELPGRRRILADLRGYAALENRITIGVGSAEGVKRGMPVVAAAGLLGIVQTVSAHESTALLITSAASTLGAIAPSHDPPPAGLVRGENSATLTVTFADPNAPIKMGDALVTTGYSELVPRGLLIGRVIQVNDNPEMGSRTARVYPAVQIGRVREVAVLR